VSEQVYGPGGEERRLGGVENCLGEAQQVGHVGEKSGMAACAFEQEGVFILHLALDSPLAEELIFLGGRDLGPEVWRRAVARGGHFERCEDLAAHPRGQLLASDGFDGFAEEDESRIGVFGAGTGLGLDGQLQAGAQDGIWGRCGVEERDVAGKAGTVRQQVAKGNFSCVLGRVAADYEAGEQFAERHFQVKQAALIEQHGCRCCGDYFGQAGYVVEGGWSDWRRLRFVGEMPKGIQKQDLAVHLTI
jgi:hypothetical protein